MRIGPSTRGATALLGSGVAAVGSFYLLAPSAATARYGLAPPEAHDPYVAAKGVRDLSSGLLIVTLSMVGDRRSLGLTMLSVSAAATGDALIVLLGGGSAAKAGVVHGLSAVLTASVGCILLRPVAAAGGTRPA